MPVFDDPSTSVPKKKKPTKAVKPPIYGPVQPPAPIIGPVQPSKSRTTSSTSKPAPAKPAPVIGPKQPASARPSVTKPPAYVAPPKKKAPKIADSNAISKSSGDLSDFLSGLRTQGRDDKIDLPTPKPEILYDPKNYVYPPDPEPIEPSLSSSMESFLERIKPVQERPENFDPEYGGPVMPERLKHVGGKSENRLRYFWDKDFIASSLSEQDPGSSFQESRLNDFIGQQLYQQQKWAQRRNFNKSNKAKDVLKKAAQHAFDGEYDYLEKELEKNPDLLEFNSYKKDFTQTPEGVWSDWEKQRKTVNDQWMVVALGGRANKQVKHYEAIRQSYQTARQVTRRAIEDYEKKYSEYVEFNDDQDGFVTAAFRKANGDTAIPNIKGRLAKEAVEQQEFNDEVGKTNRYASSTDQNFPSDIHKTRGNIKKRLGVKSLPTVREMLAVKVQDGTVDPTDEKAVMEWIDRLKNASHPDTRAMYYGFAKAVNPKLDDEKDGLPFINSTVKKYLKTKNSQDAAKQAQDKYEDSSEYDAEHSDGFWDTTGDYVSKGVRTTNRALRAAEAPESVYVSNGEGGFKYTEKEEKLSDPNSLGAVGWTIDKISRGNFAVAGAVDAWNALDKDPNSAVSWDRGASLVNPLKWSGLLMGQDFWESTDEVLADPKKLGAPIKAGYQQLLRGSHAPGTDDDIVPVMFGHVIANNAMRDPEDNIYDKKWFQNTSGFMLDLGTDPLNFVGVGVVDDALKLPARLARSMRAADEGAEVTTDGARLLNDINVGDRGPVASKAHQVQQALSRHGDESESGVAMVADEKITPFQFTVEYTKDQPFAQRAENIPRVSIPRFHSDFNGTRDGYTSEIKALNAEKKALADYHGLSHLEDKITTIAKDLAFAPNKVPEIRVGKLLEQTSIPIKTKGVSAGFHVNNPGGEFWRHIVKAMDEAVPKWEGAKLSTKMDMFNDNGVMRPTVRAASAKRAIDQQAKLHDQAKFIGYEDTSSAVGRINKDYNETLEKQITDAYGIDPITRRPSLKEEWNTQEFIDAGAPGLLNGAFDPVAVFAKASGRDADEFGREFSNTDIIDAIYNGPRMAEEADESVRELMDEARSRISYSKEKLADPRLKAVDREKAYKALALGYKMSSQHTLAGAFRYLESLKVARKAESTAGNLAADAQDLNTIANKARTAIEDSYHDIDDMGDYVGGFQGERNIVTDKPDTQIAIRNGTYENFDFKDKSWEQIIEEGDPTSFTSKSAQYEAIIDEIDSQISGLAAKTDRIRPHALEPAEAYEVDRLLPSTSSFRKADGSVDTQVISEALTQKVTPLGGPKNSTVKVSYNHPNKPKPRSGQSVESLHETARWGNYQREMAFLDNVAKFVETRAISLFRSEKTALLAEKAAKGGKVADTEVDDVLSNFWTDQGGRKVGQAERELGDRPKTLYDVLESRGLSRYNDYRTVKAVERGRNKPRDYVDSTSVEKGESPFDAVRRQQDRSVSSKRVTTGKGRQEKLDRQNLLTIQRKYDKDLLRAREIDKARYQELLLERPKLADSVVMDFADIKKVYTTAFDKAVLEVTDDINSGIVRQVPANARLSTGDSAKIMERQLQDEFRYESLTLQLEKAIADTPDKIAAVEAARKALVSKRRAMYGRVKQAKMEARIVQQTMVKRIVEDQIIQIANSPARLTGRQVQIRIMGMRKNLQFTNSMFRGAEKLADLIPESVMTNYKKNYVRPSKQVEQKESIAIRASWESKTPVLIRAHLDELAEAFQDVPTELRRGLLSVLRRGFTESYPYPEQFLAVKNQMDDVLNIINGSHEHYALKRPGEHTAEVLSLDEIIRYFPEEYKFNVKDLYDIRSNRIEDSYKYDTKTGKKKQKDKDKAPFSPMPNSHKDFSINDFITAVERSSSPTPKDLYDPFRLKWVVSMAADQARQNKATRWTIGETFGVRQPEGLVKNQIWHELKTKADWSEVDGLPGYYFPPEIQSEVRQLLDFMTPGSKSSIPVQLFDDALGIWKQGMTIYNPAYYTRNGVGEILVSALDGVTHPKYYARAKRVMKHLKKDDVPLSELIHKFDALEGTIPVDVAKGNEVLFTLKGGQKVTIEDLLGHYIDTGMMSTFVNTDLDQGVRGLANASLSGNKARRGLAKANNKVHEMGEGFEDWLRMSHFIHAMENSGKGTLKEAAAYAAQRVTRSHFDYTDFSKFEKVVMLRAFPFYKWIRRGAPLMLAHLFMTPGKMAALPKALNYQASMGFDPINLRNDDPVLSTSDIRDDKNGHLPNYSGIAPGWVRDLFAYAMQPNEDDEYGNFFRMTTPQIDGLSGGLNFIQNYKEKGILGGLADTTAYPLLNPLVKSGIELGQNQGLDPDFKHEIYGGQYNDYRGVNNAEAIGSYVARQASPHLAFLSKLSNRGKLPGPLNVTKEGYEHPSDAFRDVLSFFTGAGFYQGRQEELPAETSASSTGGTGGKSDTEPAVGLWDSVQLPKIPGRARQKGNVSPGSSNPTDRLTDGLAKGGTAGGSSKKGQWVDYPEGKKWVDYPDYPKGKGWVDYPDRKSGSGWVDYGMGSSGNSGGYGGYSPSAQGTGKPGSANWDLMELLRKLQKQVDQGDVVDIEAFKSDL